MLFSSLFCQISAYFVAHSLMSMMFHAHRISGTSSVAFINIRWLMISSGIPLPGIGIVIINKNPALNQP